MGGESAVFPVGLAPLAGHRRFHEKAFLCQAKSFARPFGGSRKGACPLAGGAAVFAAWGEPARPAFPLGKRERGVKIPSLLPPARISFHNRFLYHRRFARLPFARLVEQPAPVPVGVLNIVSGCCHLNFRTDLLREERRSTPMSQSPGLGDFAIKLKSLKPLSFFRPLERCCCGAVRRLPRSPAVDAAAPPVSAIPPQSHASWHSFLRVPPT